MLPEYKSITTYGNSRASVGQDIRVLGFQGMRRPIARGYYKGTQYVRSQSACVHMQLPGSRSNGVHTISPVRDKDLILP